MASHCGSSQGEVLELGSTLTYHTPVQVGRFNTTHILTSTPQVAPQVTPQVVAVLKALGAREMDRAHFQEKLGLSDRKNFRALYLAPAMEQGLVEFTLPDKPNSRLQKYRLTAAGRAALRRQPDGLLQQTRQGCERALRAPRSGRGLLAEPGAARPWPMNRRGQACLPL